MNRESSISEYFLVIERGIGFFLMYNSLNIYEELKEIFFCFMIVSIFYNNTKLLFFSLICPAAFCGSAELHTLNFQ